MDHSKSRVRRALVIGWGLIGADIGLQLLARGVSVVGLTRSETRRTAAARTRGVEILIGDAADPGALSEAMSGVDDVVVAAGGLLPPSAAASPLEDATATLAPLLTTLEMVRHRGIRAGVTLISSGGTVYGNPQRNPVKETDAVRPISPYGVSRAMAEMYAQMYARTFGVPVRIARCSNVYGPGQPHDRSQGAVAVFLHRVAAGMPVAVVGDGSAQRDYVYIEDVAQAVATMIVDGIQVDVVNLGSGQACTVLKLLESVSRVVNRPAVLDFQPARRHDVDAIVLDISRIQALVEYSPTTLEEGLRKTWQAGIGGKLEVGSRTKRHA